jgi:hypothetical protein
MLNAVSRYSQILECSSHILSVSSRSKCFLVVKTYDWLRIQCLGRVSTICVTVDRSAKVWMSGAALMASLK